MTSSRLIRMRCRGAASRSTAGHRTGVALLVAAIAMGALAVAGTAANAVIVAAVPLGTAAEFSVLAGSTVTNTNATVLHGSLGLAPGTAVTGFPPGTVVPPSTIEVANAVASKAQDDLAIAYVNAHGRPVDATTAADLGNATLQAGVYAADSKGPLSLTGPLVLDGAGNADSVFIFQTDSTLITASGSTVSLINGALECNVFWQVGSSATLGSDSVFVGTILALTSITLENKVTVHGRALARNGAVTMNEDLFTEPSCAAASPTTTSTTTGDGGTTTTTTTGGAGTTTTTTTGAGTTTTTTGGAGTTTTTTTGAGTTTNTAGAGTTQGAGTAADRAAGGGAAGTSAERSRPRTRSSAVTAAPAVAGPPRTGGAPLRREGSSRSVAVLVLIVGGAVATVVAVRRQVRKSER